MIQPSRRDLIKYGGLSLASRRYLHSQTRIPGPGGKSPAAAGITFVTSGSASSGVPANTSTTGPLDTTGANLLVVLTFNDNGTVLSGTPVSDNKSNTWAAGNEYDDGVVGRAITQIYYCYNPSTVGSGHTFTCSQSASFNSICVLVFKGLVSGFDTGKQSGHGAGSGTPTSIQPGSLTASGVPALYITGLTLDYASGVSSPPSGWTINQSFTIPVTQVAADNDNPGAAAYFIQTGSTSALNPTWAGFSAIDAATSMIVFK